MRCCYDFIPSGDKEVEFWGKTCFCARHSDYMNFLSSKFYLIVALAATTCALSASEESSEVSSVPEPSVAVLGGLCGIIFLLWRKK